MCVCKCPWMFLCRTQRVASPNECHGDNTAVAVETSVISFTTLYLNITINSRTTTYTQGLIPTYTHPSYSD